MIRIPELLACGGNGRSVKTLFSVVLARVASIASTFLMMVAVSRTLPIADAGTFFFLYAVGMLASTVGRLGSDTMVLREISGPGVPRGGCKTLLLETLIGSAVLTVPITILMTQAIELPLGFTALLYSLVISSVLVAGNALAVLGGAALRGLGRFVSGTLIETALAPALAGGLIAISALLNGSEQSLEAALNGYALASALAGAMGLVALDVGRRAEVTDSARYVLLRGARINSQLHMAITAGVFYAITWAPVLVLGVVGNSTRVAEYGAAARLANFINIIPAMQNAYIAPKMAKVYFLDGSRSASRIAEAAANRAVLAAAPLVLGLLAFPEAALLIFGEAYSGALLPLQILTVAFAIVLVFGPVNPTMMTIGLERVASKLNLAVLAVSIVGVGVLGSMEGSKGAAVASGLCVVAYAIAASFLVQKTTGVRTNVFNKSWRLA